MRQYLLLLLLFVPSVTALVLPSFYDDFSSGVNCNGTIFSCGNSNDRIVDTGGYFLVNLTDDSVTDYVCATITFNDSSSLTQSCIIRNGVNGTVCDALISVTAPYLNKTGWYNCSSTNLSLCGWGSGVPDFGGSPVTYDWQLDTSVIGASSFKFISYVCTGVPSVSQGDDYYFVVSDTKGVTCVGDDYASFVYASGAFSLGGNVSCSLGSFCDVGLSRNYSMGSIMNDTYCTGGCYDFIKDGSETDVDYGGAVCGNCSPDGKNSDEFYVFARIAQEENTTYLSGSNPFNEVLYCPQGSDVGGAIIAQFVFLLFISGVVFFLLLITVGIITTIISFGIVKFLKNKRKRNQ